MNYSDEVSRNDSLEFPTFDEFCSNASADSVQEFFWELDGYGLATAIFMLFLFVVGLPLNCVVAGVMLWNKLYEQPTHVLLLSLTLSDSIMLVTAVPLGIIAGFAGEFLFGDSDQVRCQFCYVGVIFTWFTLMSLFTIAIMSVDRFIFIYKPLHYEKLITSKRMTIILIFIWLYCIAVAILPVIGFGRVVIFRVFASCTVNYAVSSNYYLVVLLVSACVPLVVLTICNAWVIHIVLKNLRVVYKVRKSFSNKRQRRNYSISLKKAVQKKKQKKQVHLMQVFGSLFCASFLSWLPTIILTFATFIVDFNDIPFTLSLLCYFLLLSQMVTHPALETALISAVKEPIKRFFKRMWSKLTTALHCLRCARLTHDVEKNEPSSSCGGCEALYVFYTALLPQQITSESSGDGIGTSHELSSSTMTTTVELSSLNIT